MWNDLILLSRALLWAGKSASRGLVGNGIPSTKAGGIGNANDKGLWCPPRRGKAEEG